MEQLAIALLGFFTAGWFVLSGADIGVGMLLPHLGRNPAERRLALGVVLPLFLGNEVWLVAAAGVFIGCFPQLEGELFQGQFLPLLALVTGWVIRDSGLWWRVHGAVRGRAGCADALVVCGSWAVALSTGWLVAGLLRGDPTQAAQGSYAVGTALLVTALFAAHGVAYGALRLTGAPLRRVRRLVGGVAGPQTYALTATAMAAAPVVCGLRLPLHASAADGPVLGLVVPTLLAVTPLLLAAQAWLWWMFRGRVHAPPAYGGPLPDPYRHDLTPPRSDTTAMRQHHAPPRRRPL